MISDVLENACWETVGKLVLENCWKTVGKLLGNSSWEIVGHYETIFCTSGLTQKCIKPMFLNNQTQMLYIGAASLGHKSCWKTRVGKLILDKMCWAIRVGKLVLENTDVHVGKSKVYVLITGRAKLSQTKLLEIRPPRCWKIRRHGLNIEFMGQAIVHSISAFCARFAWAVAGDRPVRRIFQQPFGRTTKLAI